jgi:hypothetical protein
LHKDKPESTNTLLTTAISTSTSQPTTTSTTPTTKKINIGAIAGGTMGAVVVLGLLVVMGVWWLIRRRYPSKPPSTHMQSLPPPGSIYTPENNLSYSSFPQTSNRKYYVSFSSKFDFLESHLTFRIPILSLHSRTTPTRFEHHRLKRIYHTHQMDFHHHAGAILVCPSYEPLILRNRSYILYFNAQIPSQHRNIMSI